MRSRFVNWLREEHRRNPWMLPGVTLTGSAALGTHWHWAMDLARTMLP